MWGRLPTIGVIALLLLALGRSPANAQDIPGASDPGGWQPPEGTAILEQRVTWARHIPFFPANEARHYTARYRTGSGRIDVYVTDPASRRLPSADAGSPLPCERAELVAHRTDRGLRVIEALGSDRYRLFFVYPSGSTESADEPAEDGLAVDGVLCSFASGFVDAFDFFLDLRGTDAGELSFSGDRPPEFPAVVDIVP